MIFEELKEVIVENLGCDADAVTAEAELINDLGADSLDAVELSMAIEDKFEVAIPDEDFAKLVTVGDIVKAIEERK